MESKKGQDTGNADDPIEITDDEEVEDTNETEDTGRAHPGPTYKDLTAGKSLAPQRRRASALSVPTRWPLNAALRGRPRQGDASGSLSSARGGRQEMEL